MESAVILQLLQPMQIERIVNFRSQRIFFFAVITIHVHYTQTHTSHLEHNQALMSFLLDIMQIEPLYVLR